MLLKCYQTEIDMATQAQAPIPLSEVGSKALHKLTGLLSEVGSKALHKSLAQAHWPPVFCFFEFGHPAMANITLWPVASHASAATQASAAVAYCPHSP